MELQIPGQREGGRERRREGERDVVATSKVYEHRSPCPRMECKQIGIQITLAAVKMDESLFPAEVSEAGHRKLVDL